MVDTTGPRTGLPVPTEPERARRRRWILPVAVLTAIALSVTGAVLANYQPLRIGAEAAGQATAPPVGFFASGEGKIPRYVNGTLLTAVIWLHNEGPWGVTVTGVERDEPLENLLWVSDVRTPTMPTWTVAASRPFHPLALKPGGTAGVQIVFTVGHCGSFSGDTYSTVGDVRVRFRVLGVPRTVWLPLLSPVRVAAPTAADCPSG